MYFDNAPCSVCGAEVDLSPARSGHGTTEPDGSIDERTCTNPECPSRRSGGGGAASGRPRREQGGS